MIQGASVRPIIVDDIPSLKAIIAAVDLFPPEMLDDMTLYFFRDPDCPHIWLTCEEEGSLVGVAYCEPERMTKGTFNLLAIGVIPARQGYGIGTKLLKHLENHLVQRGERLLLVETMGTPAFEKTRQFYIKNGYQQEACIRDFYQDGEDKIVFRKALRRVDN